MTRNDPAYLDLTDPDHLNRTNDVADALLDSGADESQLRRLESDLITTTGDTPLLLHLATKMAISRRVMKYLTGPAHLSVVFAVYKEHQRILPSDQVAGGEDFLVRKVNQLEWLFSGRDDLTWDMIVVDDGCPEGSGRVARDIVKAKHWSDRVKVLFLADAIAAGAAVTEPLTTPDDSRKGKSIALGMWTAAETVRDKHVIVFTDADLSTHLGQTGFLMEQVLIGVLPDVVDTQCGFKGFSAPVVREIADDLLEKKFAFDIELLIKTRLRRAESIARVPIAWIDSEALSTTTDIQPYLPMLQAMVGMYRTYLPAEEGADTFAAFIENLDEMAWNRLVENIPEGITQREPAEFGGFSGVSADDLSKAAGL